MRHGKCCPQTRRLVLKRLDDAVRDGDNVVAVVRGSAVSNDGSIKAGYTAPGVAGQRNCIIEAMSMANAVPDDVSYVECHATATNIGDAIEIRGLSEAYTALGPNTQPKALGSIKGNIAHANCAAGMSVHMSIHISMHMSIHLYICLYTCLYTCLLAAISPFDTN